MGRTTTIIFIYFALCVGFVLLQIYLSKRESKWPGLVLPILSLCISLIAVFNIAAYSTLTVSEGTQIADENGALVLETVPQTPDEKQPTDETRPMQDVPSLIFTVGSVFLMYNIPTIVLLAIYFGSREKQRQRRALDKMQAQDLE